MSILGYSTAYFLPQYWVNTPLYGEKIIPLLDYILSTDYENTDMLATAFYNIESKYTNSSDLPIEAIEEIISESGYGYVRNLLGGDEDSLKLLVYTLVMVHQLKGSVKGIETVLNMLRSTGDELELSFVGEPEVSPTREVSGFTTSDFVSYSNFNVQGNPFELNFQITTGNNFIEEQCIASASDFGFYLGINTAGRLVLSLGQQLGGMRGWQVINGETRLISPKVLLPNTTYYITFTYSGYDYSVRVSLDGEKYSYYFLVEDSVPLDIYHGTIFLGIDRSLNVSQYPFGGIISLNPFSVSANNVKITQWYESFPVGEENTFEIEAEMDLGLISSEFFINFANFAKKYVYPTLAAFRAKLALRSKITFLPYVRQRVTYIASETYPCIKEYFMSKQSISSTMHVPYKVEEQEDSEEHEYLVVQPPEQD